MAALASDRELRTPTPAPPPAGACDARQRPGQGEAEVRADPMPDCGEGGTGARAEVLASREPAGPDQATLIIGLGNSLRGDDGVGPAVVERLRRRLGRHPSIRLVASDGSDLAEELAAAVDDQVIVVDAADLRLAPGAWARLSADRLLRRPEGEPGPTHALSLAEAIDLLAVLGLRPRSLEVFAVQPVRAGWEPGLTRPVELAAERVAEEILRSVTRPAGMASGTLLAPEREVCACSRRSTRSTEETGGFPWQRYS